MKFLAIVECPVVFPAENDRALSSKDMLPRPGVTRGLESRHVRVLDSRMTAVCLWATAEDAQRFFDGDWYGKASEIWGEDYRIRLEGIDSASAA